MKIKETIGIDVSKQTLDITIHSNQKHLKCNNDLKGFKALLKWVKSNSPFAKENIFYAFEHTGLYSHQLAICLSEKEIPFAMIPGLEIKRSLGIVRGKDDKVDSKAIARYAYRLRDEITCYDVPTKEIDALRRLLSLRERKVKQKAGYLASFKELSSVLVKKDHKVLFVEIEKNINQLKKSISIIEKEMLSIIKENSDLSKLYKLITSIKGVGSQIALYTIVFTNAFTKFKNYRQFASYCGIAPFPNSSGTSLRGKTKVSNLANKKMKSILDMGAKVALQHNKEMKEYYKRRLEIGKNKMSTINIIRNKLIARMFAVVKRGTPYVSLTEYV